MEFQHILIALIMAHFLCDFALQNDFVANFKARFVNGNKNDMWVWVLSAQCHLKRGGIYWLIIVMYR